MPGAKAGACPADSVIAPPCVVIRDGIKSVINALSARFRPAEAVTAPLPVASANAALSVRSRPALSATPAPCTSPP